MAFGGQHLMVRPPGSYFVVPQYNGFSIPTYLPHIQQEKLRMPPPSQGAFHHRMNSGALGPSKYYEFLSNNQNAAALYNSFDGPTFAPPQPPPLVLYPQEFERLGRASQLHRLASIDVIPTNYP